MAYIDDNGSTNEITEPFKIIGSDSALFYGSIFVKPLQKESTRISDFAELTYFTIKYIDRFGIDDTVGLMGEKPLVYFIPNTGAVEKASDEFLKLYEQTVCSIISNPVGLGNCSNTR